MEEFRILTAEPLRVVILRHFENVSSTSLSIDS